MPGKRGNEYGKIGVGRMDRGAKDVPDNRHFTSRSKISFNESARVEYRISFFVPFSRTIEPDYISAVEFT